MRPSSVKKNVRGFLKRLEKAQKSECCEKEFGEEQLLGRSEDIQIGV
jgi:hypothetical protein